ncbi:LOW QUALITY PROTEIN: hypothetical protein OSB04_024455 [Centaurea solstitialis]|uniref:Glycosyltransferase N-terminal domain-containing protein n=1 Tax=Centaurea solstitialis TaxID=347529 RepID=A0AA38T5M9_9ASTR|nr:LOW QUALITY PROTEIN: hypothetical protein OSB04_024455 [Centaurea solstitialis]
MNPAAHGPSHDSHGPGPGLLVAHGHLNQFASLSRLISTYNIAVHFVSTTTHVHQLCSRLHHVDPPSATVSELIHFHELPIPSFTSRTPHHSGRFPSHLQPAFESTLHLRGPFTDLVLSLSGSAPRVAVVHDFMMSYVVQDIHRMPNVETYVFSALSAFDSFCRTGKEFPEILYGLPSQDGCLSLEFQEFVKLQQRHDGFHVGTLFDSSRAIESEYIEYLEREEEMNDKKKKKLWAVGPINSGQQTFVTPPRSVIYVSFGTTTTFSNEQVEELANGLERSPQQFVWVARVADKGDVFVEEAKMIELPNGFEERIKGRGLVVRGWTPQMAILGHAATGGFMSHCGWNSTMESISMGVQWPLGRCILINHEMHFSSLRIRLAVVDWERRDELVTAMVVEDVIRKIMDSSEGEEMQKLAVEVGGIVQRSATDGGISRKEIESFISYIQRPN